MQKLLAQITNPAVPALQGMGGSGNSGEVGANILGRYLAILIVTSITIGGLAVLLYMTLGAIQWITADGDSAKIEKARNRMIQAIIGLAILFSVTAAVTFIGPVFGIDILRLEFINQLTGGAGGSGSGLRIPSGPSGGTPPNPGTRLPAGPSGGTPPNPGIRLPAGP